MDTKLIRRGPTDGSNLYSSYRPLRFSELYGSAKIATDGLRKQIALNAGKLSQPAIAFTGESGTGKTTVALIVALSLNCNDPQPDEDGWKTEPCLECTRCKGILQKSFEGRDPNYSVKNAAKMKIDDIIRLVEEEIDGGTSLMKNTRGTKVICLEEAHNLTKKGIENLLLPIENVLSNPRKTRIHLFLTSSEHDTLFSNRAWQSRILTYKFRPWNFQELYNILVDININEHKINKRPKVAKSVLESIIHSSDLSLRQAITLLQAVLEQSSSTDGVIHLSDTGLLLDALPKDTDDFDKFVKALMSGNSKTCYSILASSYSVRSKIAPEVISTNVVKKLTSSGIYKLSKGDKKGELMMKKALAFNNTIGNSVYQDRYTALALATAAALDIKD